MGEVKILGDVRLRQTAADGTVHQWSATNTITSGALNLMGSYLSGVDVAPKPPWMLAVGSGTAPVGRYLTSLPGETYRTSSLTKTQEGNTVVFHGYLGDAENINQIVGCYGLLAGEAQSAPNATTGSNAWTEEILFAVANEPTPFNKGGAATLSIDWVITVSGVL